MLKYYLLNQQQNPDTDYQCSIFDTDCREKDERDNFDSNKDTVLTAKEFVNSSNKPYDISNNGNHSIDNSNPAVNDINGFKYQPRFIFDDEEILNMEGIALNDILPENRPSHPIAEEAVDRKNRIVSDDSKEFKKPYDYTDKRSFLKRKSSKFLLTNKSVELSRQICLKVKSKNIMLIDKDYELTNDNKLVHLKDNPQSTSNKLYKEYVVYLIQKSNEDHDQSKNNYFDKGVKLLKTKRSVLIKTQETEQNKFEYTFNPVDKDESNGSLLIETQETEQKKFKYTFNPVDKDESNRSLLIKAQESKNKFKNTFNPVDKDESNGSLLIKAQESKNKFMNTFNPADKDQSNGSLLIKTQESRNKFMNTFNPVDNNTQESVFTLIINTE